MQSVSRDPRPDRYNPETSKLKQGIFAIKDSAAGTYSNPFIQRTRAEALRSFTHTAKDAQGRIAKSPGDYDLFLLGFYDEETGSIETTQAPERIAKASDLG